MTRKFISFMPFHSFLDFLSSLLPLVILSWWVCFSLSKMVFFTVNVDCYFLGYFSGFLIAHECEHSLGLLFTYKLLFWAIILSPYTPPWKPASGLVLCSFDDAVYGDWSFSETSPLSPLLAAGVPPVKIRPGSLYDGAALIAPEDGNTRGIWRPHLKSHKISTSKYEPTLVIVGSGTRKSIMIKRTNNTINCGGEYVVIRIGKTETSAFVIFDSNCHSRLYLAINKPYFDINGTHLANLKTLLEVWKL